MILNIFIFIAASGAAVGAICKWLWPFIRGLVSVIDAIPTLIEMSEEFQPNEGKSLRDQIDAHSTALDNIQQQLENLIMDRA